MMMMAGHGGAFGWFGWIFGMLTHVLFLVLLVLTVIWLYRTIRRPGETARAAEPLTVLKLRYAKGEISREQYEQMKQDLE